MWLDELIEYRNEAGPHLLFPDQWYWLHYEFFNCRDLFACETSVVVRTYLYNLVAALYAQFENICKEHCLSNDRLNCAIDELIKIAEHSRSFPISYWTYGDEVSRSRLQERFSGLPSGQQIEHLLEIPCFIRMQYTHMHYCPTDINDVAANMRYLKEEDAFKKRLADVGNTDV